MRKVPTESVTVVESVSVGWEVKPLQKLHDVERDVDRTTLSLARPGAPSSRRQRHADGMEARLGSQIWTFRLQANCGKREPVSHGSVAGMAAIRSSERSMQLPMRSPLPWASRG
jgi:hypothetical protein